MEKELADLNLNYYAGRIATIAGVVTNVAAAVTVLLTEADLSTIAGVGAFLTGVDALLLKFQHGAQKHEARLALDSLPAEATLE